MTKYKKFEETDADEIKIDSKSQNRCGSKLFGFSVAIGVLVICLLFVFIIYSRFSHSIQLNRKQVKTVDESEIGILSNEYEYPDGAFVIEHHDLTVSDHLHVIKDYSNNMQIMKISSPEATVCYLAPLKDLPRIANSDQSNKTKTYSNVVYEVKELVSAERSGVRDLNLPTASRSFVDKLNELCDSIDILVLEVAHSHNSSTAKNDVTKPDSIISHSRLKRNIRQCKTSCCYVVCCCDVKHFVFQSDHEFSCIHVCDVCSSEYRKKIQKIC